MSYINRILQKRIADILQRGKSILLLGARQTGKTTLLKHECQADFYYNFVSPSLRRQFELAPDRLGQEIEAFRLTHPQIIRPLVIIDEVQKVPAIMDVVQYLIDDNKAQFILTGSSARQLKHKHYINLLPGRIIPLQLDALSLLEMPTPIPILDNLLIYGNLPEIIFTQNLQHKEENLQAYVNIYLEEEIRQEASLRNLAVFSRFIELIALEAGASLNIAKLSQDVGISVYLIQEYLQILQDCLIVDVITPITHTQHRRRLTKANKYLFFDLGIQRICAKEGMQLSQKTLANLFEQFVGIEINRYIRQNSLSASLKYWRDHNGAKVDYVIEINKQYLPIEVKWTENPNLADCRHLQKFLAEYPSFDHAYIICRTERMQRLSERIIALPWQQLPSIINVIK